MPSTIPGYNYVGSVQIDELCGLFDDPNSQLNQWLNNRGVDYSATDVGCATLSVAGGLGAGGGGLVVGGVICGSQVIGCAANDAIRENTSCDDQYVDVYITKNSDNLSSPGAVMLSVHCSGTDLSDDAEQIADDIADTLESDISDAYDVSVKVGSDVVDEIANTAEDAADAATNIYNMGSDLIF
ncbi:hypothetical protein [Halarchaeum nitratireducens]|uniref:Uncharacterized protein n=1 Tax=Halarchaeum nitratireducens TaxID=489913 RepID=A0A830GFC7_9EURY|nr:hypothetical protein [Halarchaeum nitratireducens]GGN23992.1 hypothetical protein GCM10009021_27040 [Halarchaeum nitratireducens]